MQLHIIARGKIGRSPEAELVADERPAKERALLYRRMLRICLAELADMDEKALQAALLSLQELGGNIDLAGFSDTDLSGMANSLETTPPVERPPKAHKCPSCGHSFSES